WLSLDPTTGKISVKISTTNTNTYNSASINNFAVVRVRAFAGTGNSVELASRFIKVSFVQDKAQDIAVNGTITHDVVSTASVDKTVTWSTPTTLDAAYNKTAKSAADFHQVYTFTPAATGNPAGFTFDVASFNNATQGADREIAIENTVMPGTYTLKGKYESSVSTDPVVNVTITVTVTGNLITNLTKNAPFWDSGLTYGIINGKLAGRTWKLHADLWYYFTESTVNNVNKPATTYTFTVNEDANEYNGGITVNGDELQLNEAIQEARAKVNNGDVSIRVTRRVNGVVYDVTTFNKDFNVKFINPVKAITAKTPYKEFKDKEVSGTNTSSVDVRQLVKLTDFNNTVLYDYNGTTFTVPVTLLGNYGVSNINTANANQLTNVVFTRAENTSGATVNLPASTRAFYSGH